MRASGDSAGKGTCRSLATGDQPLEPGKGGKRGPTQHTQMTTWSKTGLGIQINRSLKKPYRHINRCVASS